MLADQQSASPQAPVSIDTPLSSQLGRLYPLIQQHHLSLRQNLNRFRGVDLDSDLDDPAMQEPFTTINRETRTDDLCDIISSFDNSVTPSEFKQRFVHDPPPELLPSDNGSLVQGSLPATIYHLAWRDETFFRRLQQVVPQDTRAIQYHRTQNDRAQNALQRLAQYSETGQLAPGPQHDRNLGVPACARYLRFIVEEMCEDRNRRHNTAPLGAPVLRRLAEILTRLVGQIVTWDRDVYDRARWNRIQPQNEHPRDRNLFVYMIGDPPIDPTLPSWMTNHFVIDRLRSFPSSEWSHLLERLTTIKDAIEEKDMDSLPGSISYVAAIDDMVREYTVTADEPSSSSVQMPRRA